jgi:hypothetical protein
MRKVIVFVLLLLLISCNWFNPEEPGVISTDVGGTALVSFNAADADNALSIAFDPDRSVNSGNEVIVSISMDPYRDGSFVDAFFTWVATDVPSGDYYVYAWYDIDGDGVLDSGSEGSNVYVFDDRNLLNYDNSAKEIMGDVPVIYPNYTKTDYFSYDLDIEVNASLPY